MKRIVMCSVILFVGILLTGASFAQQPLETPKRVVPFDDPEPGAQTAPPGLQKAPGGTATTYNVPGDYATIQAAIDAAVSGDVIIVANGTYAEDLLIDGKNLTIQGGGSGGSIITGDATNTEYIVKILNSAIVDFSGFTVDGTGKNIKYGVWATAGTDGDIHDNEVKNVQSPSAAGIAIRRDDSQIDVTDNTVYGFGRIGIYTRDDVIGNTDTGVVSGNTVTGLGGSDPDRLSYGISVYSGNPTVDNNDIYDCVSGANVAAWASCGLDVWTGSTSVISNNDFFDSDYGIISNSASPVLSGNTFTNISGEDVRLDYFVKGNPTPHWAEYYDTIQDAIDAVPVTTYLCIVWVGVYSGGGTYAEAVNVNKTCQIYGYDMSAVTIDPVGHAVNNAGVYVSADDVVLYDLTVEGDTGSSLPRYGVKFGDYDGCWMERVEVKTCYRTGIDILGATNLTITDVNSHDNGGNGIQMTDASDVTLENITTSGNAWGGVGIFTWGQYTPIGTSGIVFSGTNSFGETSADVGSIYLEEGNYSNPSSPWPITYSTDILDGADVTVQLADVTHTLKGNSDNDNYYTRFYATLGDAQAAAAGAVSHILDGRYITELAGTNLYVPANLGGIQAAVDAANSGDVVHVDAGSFEEQVEIDKNLTLDGAGKGVTTIESPVSLTKYFTTSSDNYPVVYIHDAADVTVSNLTVDGLGRGNSNYRFDGIGFRNAGGSVESCGVLNIADTPFSGAQHGVAVYLYNDDSVSRTIDVLDNDFSGFQKNAMALNASATTPLVVDVTGNTVTGAGATGVTAQNGIQVSGALATGTIEDNVVAGIGYTGSGWVATSILVYDGDVDVIGNTISNAHMGIYFVDAAGTISGNTLTMEKIGSYCWGIAASDPPEAVPSPFGIEEDGPMASSGIAMAPAATRDVDIMGNYVAFSGPDNTGTYGIEVDAGYSANDLVVTANGNTSTGFESGMEFWTCSGTCDTGTFVSIDAHNNNLAGNSLFGMRSTADYITVDATGNWWGDATGPYHATLNPGGLGDPVSDYIDFDPYMTGVYEISVVPSYGVTNCATTILYTFGITQAGTGGSEVRGYDVTFSVNPLVATIGTLATDVTELGYLSDVGGTAFYATDKGGGVYTVSCAILGGSTGATGDGDLFTVLFTPVGEGTSDIDITTLKLRDVNNVPIDVGGVDGVVQIDCTPPTMDAIVEAEGECYNTAPTFATFTFHDDVNLDLAEYQIDSGGWNTIFTGYDGTVWSPATPPWSLPGFGGLSEGPHTVYFRVKDDAGNWNGEGTPDTYSWSFIKDTVPPAAPTDFAAAPGNNKVHLTWTNPTGDASFMGVEIRVVGWGDYPQYGTPGPSAPSYPADYTEGTPVTQTALEAYDDDPRTPRDIYYYAAFAYDCAGNYSTGTPTSRDRATSYWLGDMYPATVGDGNIQIQDLALFSLTFGQAQGGPAWNAEGDFGPTDDYSRFGIPEPDDAVDFEDLMIFAMNYGNVSPLGTSGGPALISQEKPLREQVRFKLVPISSEGDVMTYAVVVENEAKVLKGFSLDISYGLGNELMEIEASKSLTGKSSEHFFGTIERELGRVEICVAALGVDVPLAHTGEVARIVVRQGSGGPAGVRLEGADLRDLNNRKEEIEIETQSQAYVPKVSALMQNHPNPFNPVTRITYDVANAGRVRIEIYDVSGRMVRTLVDEHRGAGRYEVEWDGRNATGTPVHTGVYFYRMSAPGYTSQAKKMLLLK